MIKYIKNLIIKLNPPEIVVEKIRPIINLRYKNSMIPVLRSLITEHYLSNNFKFEDLKVLNYENLYFQFYDNSYEINVYFYKLSEKTQLELILKSNEIISSQV